MELIIIQRALQYRMAFGVIPLCHDFLYNLLTVLERSVVHSRQKSQYCGSDSKEVTSKYRVLLLY